MPEGFCKAGCKVCVGRKLKILQSVFAKRPPPIAALSNDRGTIPSSYIGRWDVWDLPSEELYSAPLLDLNTAVIKRINNQIA